MTTPPVRVERRVGQRFPYLLPLTLRKLDCSAEGLGLTQDLSSKGVFFLTDVVLTEGTELELTLNMPSEVTLGESMRVRCRGHVLRVVKPSGLAHDSFSPAPESKIGVAVRLEHYEYLPHSADAATFPRVSALHPHHEDERPLEHSARSTVG